MLYALVLPLQLLPLPAAAGRAIAHLYLLVLEDKGLACAWAQVGLSAFAASIVDAAGPPRAESRIFPTATQ